MLTADEIKKDLNDICAQTNAHWLSYDSIHTHNPQRDISLYLQEMQRLGYSKLMLLYNDYIRLSYGGGIEIKHQDEMQFGGYTMEGYKKNKNRLIVLSGFDTDSDKYTVYHECAHLFQYKYNIFNTENEDDYTTYLSEIHANTFSSMVLLLKADSILEYKKRRLGRLADGINKVEDKKMLYYISLPIELQLMKQIRKNGRLNMLHSFQKKGALDFKKILFYTKNLVEKYAYSEEEFEQIKNNNAPSKHLLLQNKARAYHLLGEAYWKHEYTKYRKKRIKHIKIEKERINEMLKKVEHLPDNTKEAEIINEICMLDRYQVEMTSQYQIFNSIEALRDNTVTLKIPSSLKANNAEMEQMAQTFERMRRIYQTHKDDKMFQSLFKKIETLNGRDEVWALKEKARPKEISVSKTLANKQKTR